jgi:hypothetical protein
MVLCPVNRCIMCFRHSIFVVGHSCMTSNMFDVIECLLICLRRCLVEFVSINRKPRRSDCRRFRRVIYVDLILANSHLIHDVMLRLNYQLKMLYCRRIVFSHREAVIFLPWSIRMRGSFKISRYATECCEALKDSQVGCPLYEAYSSHGLKFKLVVHASLQFLCYNITFFLTMSFMWLLFWLMFSFFGQPQRPSSRSGYSYWKTVLSIEGYRCLCFCISCLWMTFRLLQSSRI